MSKGKHRNHGQVTRLAISVAGGGNITQWSKTNSVPRRTAAEWARSKAFKDLVARIRAKLIDRAAGQLADSLIVATSEMRRLCVSGQSEGVRLGAARAIMTSLIEIENHAEEKRELAKLRARLEKLEGERTSGAT